jgi:TPR repeat protein
MQRAADSGDGQCQLKLGVDYRYGNVGLAADMGKAKNYLKLADEQHLAEASAQLAEIAMYEHEDDDQQIRSGFAELTRLADANGTRAQFLLGEACILGRPWPRDPACARRRFQQAAEQGFAAAAYNLGILLESELGGPVDLDSAEVWFRKAVELGVAQSRYDLGRLLLLRGRAAEGIQNLLAVVAGNRHIAAYVVTRYCTEHIDCGVASTQRAQFEKILKDMPEETKHEVAWSLATDALSDAKDGRYAVQLMESMPEKDRAKWDRIDTLAASYARAGEFDLAVRSQRQAIASAPSDMLQRMRKILNERLTLYQSRKTCDFLF